MLRPSMDAEEFQEFYRNCTPGGTLREIELEISATSDEADFIVIWAGTNNLKHGLNAIKNSCKSLLGTVRKKFKRANVSYS